MNNEVKNIINEFKIKTSGKISSHIKKIVLFGSRARGEADDDSDIDLLVMIDEKSHEIAEELEDIAYNVMWDYDFSPILSLKIMTRNSYNTSLEKGFSFYKNIEKDGVVV